MKLMVLLTAAACALGGPGAQPEPPAPTLDGLAFLAGAWEAKDEAEGEQMREVWDMPRGDAMVGHFSIVASGKAVLYELLVIELDETGPVMRLRHFGPGLEPWASEAAGPLTMRLAELGERRAVFEDPARAFPRRVVYTREGDRLGVLLEPAPDADREAITISFERATE
ncbi:MAG: hypothetical protein IT431_03220 [Phycisphaerales bacterium]|nr:hypothetical protein [Phycisphaerales bacterium]